MRLAVYSMGGKGKNSAQADSQETTSSLRSMWMMWSSWYISVGWGVILVKQERNVYTYEFPKLCASQMTRSCLLTQVENLSPLPIVCMLRQSEIQSGKFPALHLLIFNSFTTTNFYFFVYIKAWTLWFVVKQYNYIGLQLRIEPFPFLHLHSFISFFFIILSSLHTSKSQATYPIALFTEGTWVKIPHGLHQHQHTHFFAFR